MLGEPDLFEAGFAGLFFLGGVPGIFSGPDFSGIRNLPFCDIAESAAINSEAGEKPSANIPICKPGPRAENRALNHNKLIFYYISS